MKAGYYDFGAWIAGQEPEAANLLQSFSEKTRLKIPYLIGMDAAHGYATCREEPFIPHRSAWQPLSTAALRNRPARKLPAEIRSAGTHWTFAPCVDIVCDARWGRTGETYGEDPSWPPKWCAQL